jgi:hypothetical protein
MLGGCVRFWNGTVDVVDVSNILAVGEWNAVTRFLLDLEREEVAQAATVVKELICAQQPVSFFRKLEDILLAGSLQVFHIVWSN